MYRSGVYCDLPGLTEIRRFESEEGQFSLIYLSPPEDKDNATINDAPLLELTCNWDPEEYRGGRNFGHLAYEVNNIHEICQHLMDNGITIDRPPTRGEDGICPFAG